MILLRRNIIDLEPVIAFADTSGRVLALKIKSIDGTDSLLVNVYGHNTDTPELFQYCSNEITKSEISSFIIGGDFNVPLVCHVDTTAKTDYTRKN